MENLSLEKFSPGKAEIVAKVEKYKGLTIKDPTDATGYSLVEIAWKDLKNTRVQVQKDGKAFRAEALAFQKAVIEKEKELVGLIEPMETEYGNMLEAVDAEKEKEKRRKLLPERVAKLAEIECVTPEETLLGMNEKEFQEHFLARKDEYLNLKQQQAEEKRLADEEAAAKKANDEAVAAAALKEKAEKELQEQRDAVARERAKVEEEKAEFERQKQKAIEIEAAKVEAAKKAKEEAEAKALRDKLDAEQRIKDEEARKAKAEADRIADEKAKQEALEKKRKYQAFLRKNGYVDCPDFYLSNDGTTVTLWKRLDTFTL